MVRLRMSYPSLLSPHYTSNLRKPLTLRDHRLENGLKPSNRENYSKTTHVLPITYEPSLHVQLTYTSYRSRRRTHALTTAPPTLVERGKDHLGNPAGPSTCILYKRVSHLPLFSLQTTMRLTSQVLGGLRRPGFREGDAPLPAENE